MTDAAKTKKVMLSDQHVFIILKHFLDFIDRVNDLFYVDSNFIVEQVEQHLSKYGNNFRFIVSTQIIDDTFRDETDADSTARQEDMLKDVQLVADKINFRRDQSLEELANTLNSAIEAYQKIYDDNGISLPTTPEGTDT